MQNQEEGLSREIGVFGLSANIINIVVGAGIFALPALIASSLGNAAILAYLFCGLLIALVMLCFAEVGTIVTTSGGPYAYIEMAFGKYAGFIALFLFLISAVTADAAVANALADVLASFLPVFHKSAIRVLFFLVMFGGLAYINVVGVRQGINLVKFTTIAKLTPLVFLILFGWIHISPEYLNWHGMPPFRTLGETALLLFFAFQGAESGLIVGGEVKSPERTIPRAILLAVAGVLSLYILIQVTSQGVLGPELAQHKSAPLSAVGNQIFGPVGFILLTAGAAISMFGNLSGEILNVPRMLFRAARDLVLPIRVLGKVHPQRKTPYVAIAVYAGVGIVLSIFGGFEQLAIVSSTAILLIYFGVAMSVIRFRQKEIRAPERGFRIPGGYLIPIAAAAVVVWLLSSLSGREIIGTLIVITGLSIVFVILQRFTRQKEEVR